MPRTHDMPFLETCLVLCNEIPPCANPKQVREQRSPTRCELCLIIGYSKYVTNLMVYVDGLNTNHLDGGKRMPSFADIAED